jgi:hypothetical protein
MGGGHFKEINWEKKNGIVENGRREGKKEDAIGAQISNA